MQRVAIVGAGSIGREFGMRHFVEELGVTVAAVVDLNSQLAETLARDISLRIAGGIVEGPKYNERINADSTVNLNSLQSVTHTAKIDEIWDDINIVYVATPPSSHAYLTILALSHGKHVLLEKPIAVVDEHADEIVAAAEQAWLSQRLVVNMNIGMGYNDAALELRRRIRANAFGNIQEVKLKMHFKQWPRSWQMQNWVDDAAQGGPLLEVGTHWIFGLLLVLDVEDTKSCIYSNTIKRITSSIQYNKQHTCEQVVHAVIELESGLCIDVDVNTNSSDAIAADKDIYELSVKGTVDTFILVDFTKLKSSKVGDVVHGSYGRKDCIVELLKAVHTKSLDNVKLVSPADARRTQRVIQALKNEGVTEF